MAGRNIPFRFGPGTQGQLEGHIPCVLMFQTQSRMMSNVWQAACCRPLEPVSLAWKLVPWTLKECAPPGGSPTLVSWIYFCWVRQKLSPGLGWSLEPFKGRMRTMEPRQALTNTSHVENLDFLKVVLRPSQSDSNRAEEKGKSTH